MRTTRFLIVICGIASALALAATVVFAPLLFGTRPLDADERSVAEAVFGDSVKASDVRVRSGGPLTWTGAAVTIGNVISFPRGAYDGDGRMRPWLVHELTHVWQYQHHGLDYIPRSVWEQLSERDAYQVHFEEGKRFDAYDVEEQAVLVSDHYATGDERYAPLIEEMRKTPLP